MLKALAIGLGILIIITRGLGVISPGRMRDFLAQIGSGKPFNIRVLGVFLLVLSLLVYLALGGDLAGARLIMGIFGILFVVGGFALIFLPTRYGALIDWFMKLSDPTMRLLCAIGVVVGALIVLMALVCY